MTIDIQLLRVVQALSQHGTVTGAAEEMGLTQSTISHALGRLREHYKDPLFVRSGNKLQQTSLASLLVDEAARVVRDFDRVAVLVESFEPWSSRRTFRIHMNDLSELVLLPTLLSRWSAEGFASSIEVVRVPVQQVWQELEAGRIDLVIGTPAPVQPNLHRRRLFEEKYIGIARASHPLRGRLSSVAGYLSCNHCVVQHRGPVHAQLEARLSALGAERRIHLQVPGLLSVPTIVAQSDLVAAVPSSIVNVHPGRVPLHVFTLPVAKASFEVVQHWHARRHHDPAHKWLRAEIQRSAGAYRSQSSASVSGSESRT